MRKWWFLSLPVFVWAAQAEACPAGFQPTSWACVTFPGDSPTTPAQQTDILFAARPGLGSAGQGSLLVQQVLEALTTAQVTAALGFTPLSATGNGSAVTVTPAATGGGPRQLGTIAVDYVEALGFAGIDSTGVADSTAAINNALAVSVSGQLRCVHLSAGTYKISNSIFVGSTASPGCLVGDYGKTFLVVNSNFNASAAGIVVMTSPLPPSSATGTSTIPGGDVEYLTIVETQSPNVTNRAAFRPLGSCTTTGTLGCEYPPAILATAMSRERIAFNEIDSCWTGIVANGSSNTGGIWLTDNKIGCVNIGASLDGFGDFTGEVSRNEFWPFGMFNVPSLNAIYGDGTTIGLQLAEVQGLSFNDNQTIKARTVLTGNYRWAQFNNLKLDDGADFEYNGLSGQPLTVINGGYQTGAFISASGNCAFNLSGGTGILMSNFHIDGTGSESPVCITGTFAGTLSISNSSLSAGDSGLAGEQGVHQSLIVTSSGTATVGLIGDQFSGVEITTADIPIQLQTQDVVQIAGDTFLTTHGNAAFYQLGDQPASIIEANNFNGRIFTPPGTSGLYQTQWTGTITNDATLSALNVSGAGTIESGTTSDFVVTASGGDVNLINGGVASLEPGFAFTGGGATLFQLGQNSTTAPANFLKLLAVTASNGPKLEALGADTNISMQFAAKGTGEIQAIGHLASTGGGTPTATVCGGTGSISGTDSAFDVAVGGTSTTTCTITPGTNYSAAPHVALGAHGAAVAGAYVITSATNEIIIGFATATTNGVVSVLAIPTQ